jgi:hypothetical protein
MEKSKSILRFIKNNFELIFWVSGLIYLSLISPEQNHFSFCPLNQMGITFCPGCGLGRSISYLIKLKFLKSFETHPLGIFAFFILIFRIIQLTINLRREYNGKHLQLSSRN